MVIGGMASLLGSLGEIVLHYIHYVTPLVGSLPVRFICNVSCCFLVFILWFMGFILWFLVFIWFLGFILLFLGYASCTMVVSKCILERSMQHDDGVIVALYYHSINNIAYKTCLTLNFTKAAVVVL